jgi:hypothetical protein
MPLVVCEPRLSIITLSHAVVCSSISWGTLRKRLVDVNRHTAYRLYVYRLYRLGFIELRADSPKQFSGFDPQGLGELHDCH